MIRYFRFSFDYALHDISFANLSLLLATIPTMDDKNDTDEKGEEITGKDLKDFIGFDFM